MARPRSFDREEALEKAMHLFWKKGYEGTTMADIVQSVGIQAPGLYAAFGSKDQLFVEVVSLYNKNISKLPIEALNNEQDIYNAAKFALYKCVEVYVNPNHPSSCLIMFGAVNTAPENHAHAEALKQVRYANKQAWIDRLIRAKEEGQLLEHASTEILAEYFVTVIHGLALRSKDGSGGEALIATCDLALSGLMPYLTKSNYLLNK